MCADEKTAVDFILSAGQRHDASDGRLLMDTVGKLKTSVPLVMDKAYEDDHTRYVAWTLGSNPVVRPKKNRTTPWEYLTTATVEPILKTV